MGLMDKLRAELIDVVEWIDDSRRTLAWRFPRYHNQLKNGAQLIVRPGQVAVLVSGGKLADVFGPGTHRLETRNLPILSTIQAWKQGFDSPFKAEVYFVSTRQLTELKWGTPNPVILRDPDLGPLRARAFGTYTLTCRDPRALVRELVGTSGVVETEEIGVLLRGIIVNAFSELVATAAVSVVDVASTLGELSERLRTMVVERIDDEYGLDMPQLWIVNVSLPAEVEQAIDARTSRQVLGDLGSYREYQIGRATPVAAANPAGGLAGAGVGLGMGMAYAQQMPAGPAPTPLPITFHVTEAGRTVGPLDLAAVAAGLASGRFSAGTLVWTPGLSAWTPAASVPALAGLFPPPPPPPPAGA
jgi:membrane protease subunit (stomatin/prohibitin family)